MIMINILLLQNLTAETFAARLKQTNLATKSDIAGFVKKTDFDNKLLSFNKRINSSKTKHLQVENEFKKSQAFDLSYFRGKSHFEDDGTQNQLVFQPMHMCFKKIGNTDHTLSQKSKQLSDESIKHPSTSDNIYNSLLNYVGTKIRVKFNGSCLKQNKNIYAHGKIVNKISK